MKRKEKPYVLTPGTALSPLDGRYNGKVKELSPFFSESALMRFRLLVEVEWLIFINNLLRLLFADQEKKFLRNLYRRFSLDTYQSIKEIEKTTNHDVNAVVLYLQGIVKANFPPRLSGIIHLGLTSEDINCTSFGLMLRGGLEILIERYNAVMDKLHLMAEKYETVPLLAHTHGQPASPTTVGWELNVFTERLEKIMPTIKMTTLEMKFGGATGGHNALYAAFPDINWRRASDRFIRRLNRVENSDSKYHLDLLHNPYCTQRESMDSFAKLFNDLRQANNVLIDLNRDIWTYISWGIFVQIPKKNETGSSAMPHKVNPIDFENSEGNLGLANILFSHFSDKLVISRLQRDLSDSTVIRNFGIAFGYTLLALKSLEAGLGKIELDSRRTSDMLDNNWAVLAEGIQTILRREYVSQSYDLLKDLTRGRKEITKDMLHAFIDEVAAKEKLPEKVVAELKALTPHNYIGDRLFN